MRGYTIDKQDYLLRLRKIEGQVRGLQRMVDDDSYCIDIITQVGSITGALQSVALGLVDQHFRHCVLDAMADPQGDPDTKLTEATKAIERLLRT
jgi:DNA-binding FrmR family transcriptional regulator